LELYFLPGPHPVFFFFFWNFSHPPHCPSVTYVPIYLN
jgi:hypothetical protein